ncbi:MAG: NADH-quinone oxidoreductase subunit N [Bacteroidota bacterium]
MVEKVAYILSQITESLPYLAPEFWLTGLFVILIILDLVIKNKPQLLLWLSLIIILPVSISLINQWQQQLSITLFGGMLQLDNLAIFAKFLLVLALLLTLLISVVSREPGKKHGEYYIILIPLLLGTFLMSMATNLLSVYLTIELVSISSFILVVFRFQGAAYEAGIKYRLFGALASGIMLYGMSLLYGFTGTLEFTSAVFIYNLKAIDASLAMLAGVMVLAGLLFKLSLVPFHFWSPDAYEKAPIPVIAFLSVVPKIAAFIILYRLVGSYLAISDIFVDVQYHWVRLLAVLALASIIFGNLAALRQKNAKRMMAYSSIAHSGFMLIGLLGHAGTGLYSLFFYLTIYLFMNFAGFLGIQYLYKKTGSEEMADYAGLGLSNPFWGVILLITMVALTGLPPTAGFSAKFFVFTSLWQSYQVSQESLLLVLFVAGLLNAAVSLLYYLRIPYLMFFRPQQNFEINDNKNALETVLGIIIIFPVLFFFFKADWLYDLINHIKFAL